MTSQSCLKFNCATWDSRFSPLASSFCVWHQCTRSGQTDRSRATNRWKIKDWVSTYGNCLLCISWGRTIGSAYGELDDCSGSRLPLMQTSSYWVVEVSFTAKQIARKSISLYTLSRYSDCWFVTACMQEIDHVSLGESFSSVYGNFQFASLRNKCLKLNQYGCLLYRQLADNPRMGNVRSTLSDIIWSSHTYIFATVFQKNRYDSHAICILNCSQFTKTNIMKRTEIAY